MDGGIKNKYIVKQAQAAQYTENTGCGFLSIVIERVGYDFGIFPFLDYTNRSRGS